jgi:hypothetical protein
LTQSFFARPSDQALSNLRRDLLPVITRFDVRAQSVYTISLGAGAIVIALTLAVNGVTSSAAIRLTLALV